MSTADRRIENGTTYTAIFVDGPFDNQTEERPVIDGEYEEVVEQLAAVDTKEIIDVPRSLEHRGGRPHAGHLPLGPAGQPEGSCR